MIPRADITGLVLAGGRAKRFGGIDKGWIDFNGRPLIESACERLLPQVATLLISANRNIERYEALAPVVRDPPGGNLYGGPLAGIVAALGAIRTEWLALVPCDVPAFPLDFVERLARAIGDAPAACAESDGHVEPLFALLHRSLRADIDDALARGERSATECLKSLGAVLVDFDAPLAFANLNTPADLERAAGTAAAADKVPPERQATGR